MADQVASEHPFAVSDEKDHAETPFDAYRDIEPFLFQLAMRRKRSKAKVGDSPNPHSILTQ
jgi:hypothetical protein